MYLPTTREGYLAAIGRFIWETRIEPMSIADASRKTKGNPFTQPAAKAPRPTAESAMAAVVARVKARKA